MVTRHAVIIQSQRATACSVPGVPQGLLLIVNNENARLDFAAHIIGDVQLFDRGQFAERDELLS